ncbi:hypothetical protein BDS110ZK12_86040 [Bradyrhizobium diazoefficiens]
MECFTPTAETPMLQEPVHVDDGEQRTDGSLNAKDNFAVGERSRSYWRRRAPFHREGWVGGGWSGG